MTKTKNTDVDVDNLLIELETLKKQLLESKHELSITQYQLDNLKERYNKATNQINTQTIRNACLETINSIYELTSKESLDSLDINVSLDKLVEHTMADIAVIYDEKGGFVQKSSFNISNRQFMHIIQNYIYSFRLNYFIDIKETLDNNKIKYIDAEEDDRNADFFRKNGVNQLVFIPINDKNGKKYLMLVNSPLKEKHVGNFYKKVQDQYKSLFERVEERRKLIDTSNIDELTGLNNANKYHTLIREINGAEIDNVIVILGDLFRLKYVNDNYGHTYGDQYIKKTGEILKEVFYEEDDKYRIGGDEFFIILHNKDEEEIIKKLSLIQEKLKNADLRGPNNEYLDTNISFGYAIHEKGPIYIEELVEIADDMLKENKTILYYNKGVERRK